MHKLLNPREASLDGEVEPLFILWSKEGSLDNQPNAWYTPNHFVPVIWKREASPAAGETTKGTGFKQGTILSFFKVVASKSRHKTGKFKQWKNQERREEKCKEGRT